ncbi:MAG: ABC transporter ATP-binding protein [Spirochaetales bacterium]|nr:ABC transporter ATP-binding protein [Spirochaetales bacterium]
MNKQKESKIKSLIKMFGLLNGFRGMFFLAIVSLSLAALIKSASFIYLRFILDEVFGNPVLLENIVFYCLFFILFLLGESVLSVVQKRTAARSAEGLTKKLRSRLFGHLQNLSFRYYDNAESGDILERVTSDVDNLNTFFNSQATEIGRIVALVVFNFISLLYLQPGMAFLALAFIPLVVGISIYFFKRITQGYKRYQEIEAEVSVVLHENITANRLVRAFNQQKFEEKKFTEKINDKFRQGIRIMLMHACYWPVTDLICFGQIIMVLLVGSRWALGGEMTIGSYIAVTAIVAQMVWPVRNVGRIFIEASHALVSFDRVETLLNEKPEVQGQEENGEAHEDIRGNLELVNVSFGYREDQSVLSDVSVKIKAGEKVALVGPTGCGKTSLVNLIPRFYEPKSGYILLDGKMLNDYPVNTLRHQIGIVEQEPFLFSCSLRENITYGVHRAVDDDEVIAAAEKAQIHDVIMKFNQAYDTLVGEKGVTLSGGQKQRIAIARTILKNPALLILDDATSSVDMETEQRIKKALFALMKGKTSFIIAHRVETVMRADRILVLDKGYLVQVGTHEELIKENGLYKTIFHKQLEGFEKTKFLLRRAV